MLNKIDELKDLIKENNFLVKKEVKQAEEAKKVKPWVIALAIIGGIVAIAGIAYAVYYFLIPEDSEDFEDLDDFDDDSDDDLEGDV